MRHDKRDEDGMYRELSAGETRAKRARDLSQSHTGPFTHNRDAMERRESIPRTIVPADVPRFKNGRVNRDGWHLDVKLNAKGKLEPY